MDLLFFECSSSAPLMGAGIGLGIGAGLGSTVNGAFGCIATEINTCKSVETKECPKCHSEIDTKQRFCCFCGLDREQIGKKSNKVKILCSKYGQELTEKFSFCSGCGKKYNPCPSCGIDLEEGITICYQCGYKKPQECQCPKCGTEISWGIKFCPECGERLKEV